LIVAYNTAVTAVILWGAYVRASESGAGCGSRWPLLQWRVLALNNAIADVDRIHAQGNECLFASDCGFSRRLVLAADLGGRLAPILVNLWLFLLLNDALLGALLVLSDHVGLDRSAAHALFLCLHFGNTLLLLAALALTARWLSNRERRFVVVAKLHERIASGLGLVSVMVIGMTGSLASLGDAIFPALYGTR
jgi:cytochrome c oxidase assembly protein subunit 15